MAEPTTLKEYVDEIAVLAHRHGWWGNIETPSHTCMRITGKVVDLFKALLNTERTKDNPLNTLEDALASVVILTFEAGARSGIDVEKAVSRKFKQLKVGRSAP